jgi:hypothetical protein
VTENGAVAGDPLTHRARRNLAACEYDRI